MQFLREVGRGDVARQVRRASAGLLNGGCGFGCGCGVQIVDHDGGAGGRQFLGDGPANAAARAGDESYFGIECEGHRTYSATDKHG